MDIQHVKIDKTNFGHQDFLNLDFTNHGEKNLDIFGRLAIKKFPGRFPPQGFILVSMGIILLIMCSLNESIEPPLTLLSNVREVLSIFTYIVSIL